MVTKKAAAKKAGAEPGGGKRVKDLDAKRKGSTVKGGGAKISGPHPVGPGGTGG